MRRMQRLATGRQGEGPCPPPWRGFVVVLALAATISACSDNEYFAPAPSVPVAENAATGAAPPETADDHIPAPTGVRVSATTEGSITFRWSRVPGARGYWATWDSHGGSSGDPNWTTTLISSTYYTVTTTGGAGQSRRLRPGDTVYFRVMSAAYDSDGAWRGGPWSRTVRGTTAGPPPPPVSESTESLDIYGLVVTGTDINDYSRIPDALVGLTSLDTMEMEDFMLSAHNGSYGFRDLPEGRYRVDVDALGYKAARPQYARSGADYDEIQLDFWLTPDELAPEVDRRRFRRSTWSQLGFNAYECPTPDDCPEHWTNQEGETFPISPLLDRYLYVLPTTSPNFHIRTHNDAGQVRLSSTWVRRIREAIPEIVSEVTGEPYVGEITSGRNDLSAQNWVTIEASTEAENPDTWETNDDSYLCGWARIGATWGRLQINKDRTALSASRGKCGLRALIAHEIGHALGFYHVEDIRSVMAPSVASETFTRSERYHAQLAYAYGRYTPYFAGPQMATQTLGPLAAPVIACRGSDLVH